MLLPRRVARHSAVTELQPSAVARKRSRGQSVVEFTLILPVFLLLTIGIVDSARMFNSYVTLNNGVSEAAIFAATTKGYLKVCPTGTVSCPPPNLATGYINCSTDWDNVACHLIGDSTFLDLTQLVLAAPACAAACATGDTVTISATYGFKPIIPVSLLSMWPGGIQLKASTTVTILP